MHSSADDAADVRNAPRVGTAAWPDARGGWIPRTRRGQPFRAVRRRSWGFCCALRSFVPAGRCVWRFRPASPPAVAGRPPRSFLPRDRPPRTSRSPTFPIPAVGRGRPVGFWALARTAIRAPPGERNGVPGGPMLPWASPLSGLGSSAPGVRLGGPIRSWAWVALQRLEEADALPLPAVLVMDWLDRAAGTGSLYEVLHLPWKSAGCGRRVRNRFLL